MKNIDLPFTMDTKSKNSKSFKIMNNSQIDKKMKKGGIGLMNSIKKLISNSNSKNNSKITYIKASESLKYEKK